MAIKQKFITRDGLSSLATIEPTLGSDLINKTHLDSTLNTLQTAIAASISAIQAGSSVVISDTQPASPVQSMLWIDSTDMSMYTYYNGVFVQILGSVQTGGQSIQQYTSRWDLPVASSAQAPAIAYVEELDNYFFLKNNKWVSYKTDQQINGGLEPTDPHYLDVVYYLRADTDFTDFSTRGHISSSQNGAAITTQLNRAGGGCLDLTGNKYLSVAPSTDFEFTGGDFTIEMDFYFPTITGAKVLFAYQADYHLGAFMSNGIPMMFASSNGSSWDLLIGDYGSQNGKGTFSVVAGVWNHFVMQRAGDVWTMYINGVICKQVTVAGSIVVRSEALNFGRWGGGGYICDGYIDEVRITKGLARYNGEFTPLSGDQYPIS